MRSQDLDSEVRSWSGNSDGVIRTPKQRKRASEYNRVKLQRIIAPQKNCRSPQKSQLHGKCNRDVDDTADTEDSYTETDFDPGYTSDESSGSGSDIGESIFSRSEEETGTDTEYAAGSVESSYASDATAEDNINRLDRLYSKLPVTISTIGGNISGWK
jgi:hypothetical protein